MRFQAWWGAACGAVVWSASPVFGWDYAGHRIVNGLALAGLPPEFPAFVKTPAAAERIAFLGGEPDRWRNVPDAIMRQSGGSWSHHFFDLEHIADAGLDVHKLPALRYDFIVAYAAARAAHADKFPPIDPAKNTDHTAEWPGFAPWVIAEYTARLKSGFSYLKAFQESGGTPEEIANAEANIIYVMGVMGHYVGDLAQPLHTTHHFNGWTGPNPNGYTTWNGFHSWIDGGYMLKTGLAAKDILPLARPARVLSLMPDAAEGRDPLFVHVMNYFLAQHAQLVPLYELDKAGKLKADGPPGSPEARAFFERQLLAGGEMLGTLWMTAWRSAPPDTYLRSQLIKRATTATDVK